MSIYIEDYATLLKRQYKYHKCMYHRNDPNNTRAAVIIEPRKHDLLIETINNVMSYLGLSWNVYVLTHTDNNSWLREHFDKSIDIINISSRSLSAKEYNELLLTENFWNLFKEEHILIFQTDSCIMNTNVNIHDFLRFPFIGGYYFYFLPDENENKKKDIVNGYVGPMFSELTNAIHLHNSPRAAFSINGGFSLRQRSKMLECIRKVKLDDIISHRKKHNMNNKYYESCVMGEDTFFQNALDILGYPIPTKEQCSAFCENLCCTSDDFNKNALGVHNTNKEFMMSMVGLNVIERLITTFNLFIPELLDII